MEVRHIFTPSLKRIYWGKETETDGENMIDTTFRNSLGNDDKVVLLTVTVTGAGIVTVKVKRI